MIKIGMVIGDRYEVLEKIGTGGMSDVYKAKDHKLNRLVAVKILKQEFSENENFVSKFRVEAQSTAGLMHPNIVNVYDVGDEDGINYIVMELVDGITLKKYIEKKVRLSVKEAVSIAIQVAMGLEAAHNNNIIHRDIKPQNIMISKDGKVKVTDFGIAKAATSNTITSNVMGSVHYTSPEQARGGYSDAKSDIYSLGITLFEMLTGRVPFNGDTTVAIAIKHIQEELPTPVDFNDEIPISVEKIVLKCCQKSPDRRYQNAAELIQDLKKSLITPDVDFVSLVDPDEEGATRVASNEEVRHVRNRDSRVPESDQMRLKRDVIRDYEHDDYDRDDYDHDDYERDDYDRNDYDDYDRDVRRSRDYDDYDVDEEDDDYYYEDEIDRRRKGTMQEDGKLERVTASVAVVMAIIIGLVLVMLFTRRLGLFGTTESAANSSASEASKEEVESGIPDVVGKTYAQAKSILVDDKGFVIKKEVDKENTKPKDVVAAMSPKAGTKLEPGDEITLYVSNGSSYKKKTDSASESGSEDIIEVPDLMGKDSEEAIEILIEKGLEPGETKEVQNADPNLSDKICRQSVAPGTKVKKGTVIHLEVSVGPGAVTYCYTGGIPAPSEGEYYVPGIPVHVSVVTSDGTTIHETDSANFPINVDIRAIAVPTGTINYSYNATIPPQTNPETGEVIAEQRTEPRTYQRAIQFNPETN